MQTEVKFICPQCGRKWIEWQNPNDEWYRCATRQTLCQICARNFLKDIKNKNNGEQHK